jgi:hypothetical protein
MWLTSGSAIPEDPIAQKSVTTPGFSRPQQRFRS